MGADERLLQHRTTPVTVDLWVDNILLDVLDHPDIYDDAYDELDRREDEVPAPDDVDATPPPGFEWLDERDEHGLPAWLDDPEKVSAVEMLNAELKDRPLTPGEQAERQALDRIAALREPLDARRRAELGPYAEDLTRAITAKLEQLDLNVPVNVTIGRAPHGADLRYGTTPLPGETTAALTTPLPRRSLNHPGPATLPGTPLKRAERLCLTGGRRISDQAPRSGRCRLVILLHVPAPGLAGHVVVFSPRRKRSGA